MVQTHLDTSQLLWRTRGAAWDFDFVLRPQVPALSSWLDVFGWVFPENQAPLEGVEYRKGSLVHDTRGERTVYTFYASAFSDAKHVDTAGRKIQQFFVYIVKPKEEGTGILAKIEWAHELLYALAAPYAAIFDLNRGADETARDYTRRLTEEFHSKLPSELSISVNAGASRPNYIDMGEFEFPDDDPEREKKAPRPEDPPPSVPRVGWGMILIGASLLILILLGRMLCG